jgi:superfamily II DNA/RNA helicase
LERKIKINKPKIIVGTISIIYKFLSSKIIEKNFSTIVFDEMDMFIEFGFNKEINTLLGYVDNRNLQKIACSATLHNDFQVIIKKYFNNAMTFSTTSNI